MSAASASIVVGELAPEHPAGAGPVHTATSSATLAARPHTPLARTSPYVAEIASGKDIRPLAAAVMYSKSVPSSRLRVITETKRWALLPPGGAACAVAGRAARGVTIAIAAAKVITMRTSPWRSMPALLSIRSAPALGSPTVLHQGRLWLYQWYALAQDVQKR